MAEEQSQLENRERRCQGKTNPPALPASGLKASNIVWLRFAESGGEDALDGPCVVLCILVENGAVWRLLPIYRVLRILYFSTPCAYFPE